MKRLLPDREDVGALHAALNRALKPPPDQLRRPRHAVRPLSCTRSSDAYVEASCFHHRTGWLPSSHALAEAIEHVPGVVMIGVGREHPADEIDTRDAHAVTLDEIDVRLLCRVGTSPCWPGTSRCSGSSHTERKLLGHTIPRPELENPGMTLTRRKAHKRDPPHRRDGSLCAHRRQNRDSKHGRDRPNNNPEAPHG